MLMEFEEARQKAEQLARETKTEHAVRQSFSTGEFFVCVSTDAKARSQGSLEHVTNAQRN
jgi:hypothetical protein